MPAISIEGLYKCYRIGLLQKRSETLGGALFGWLKSPVENYRRLRSLSRFSPDEVDLQAAVDKDDLVWALKDVSFTVEEGEVIGIIGRNGAGKSTLLKILSRITEPTAGRAVIRGRVASLLEVGTGFHPELTGRENVYLNGVILGMKKAEIDKKFDAIVSFAEVERFLDTPVKRYSSGMTVRLAFAVAAHLEPEILLVDEVLAVGDAVFQKKCIGKMGEVAKGGRTVLFVSHNMGAVSNLCDSAVLLDQGEIKMKGNTEEIISAYLSSGSGLVSRVDAEQDDFSMDSSFRFITASLLDPNTGNETTQVTIETGVDVFVVYEIAKEMQSLIVAVELWDSGGICILTSIDLDPRDDPYDEPRLPGRYHARCHIPGSFLRPGRYYVTVGAAIPKVLRLGTFPRQLSFDVLETGDPCLKIGQGRRGIIAPVLDWDIQREPLQ